MRQTDLRRQPSSAPLTREQILVQQQRNLGRPLFSLTPVQEDEQIEKIKLSKILDRDSLFRFAYVPFVIARLVWDYTDTLLDLSALMKLRETRPLCRAIRELRRDYDRFRARYIDEAHKESEEENMLVFEDGVSDITKLLLTNIRIDLKSEYPDLRPEFVDFLVAVYQCEITLLSLLRYTEKQTEKVERLVGHKIGKILPSELRRLSILVPQFVGDKPISDRFRKQKQTYVETFATQMALIELDGTALDDTEEESL